MSGCAALFLVDHGPWARGPMVRGPVGPWARVPVGPWARGPGSWAQLVGPGGEKLISA